MEDENTPHELSRREYLRLAGLAGTAGAAGCNALFPGRREGLRAAEESESYWSGPEDDRPGDAAPGTRYFATDTGRQFVATRSGWRPQGFSGPFVDAAEIRGVADYVVTTTPELEAAMASLSGGETVFVAAGTYRPREWLVVDESDVTVVGQSRRGTLVKPADGANVGGFHVGRDRHVENVLIRGIGVDGNAARMDQSEKRLHAFLVENARNVTVRDCFATHTSPYHEHDAGGSGFTVHRNAEDVAIVGNYTDDIGDRAIQVAGSYILVRGNRLTNGFDRSISLEVRHPDGHKYYSRNVSVLGNLGRDNSDGSVVGASQGDPRRTGAGNYAIVGNVAFGRHRRTVYMGITEDARNISIVGNVGRQPSFREERSGIYVSGNLSNVAVVGNSLEGYTLDGIELDSGGTAFTVANNSVRGPARDGIRVDATNATVSGNTVDDAGRVGINVLRGDASVTNNTVHGAGAQGIALGGERPSILGTNAVREAGRADQSAAGVRVAASDSVVATNLVTGARGPGIADADGAGGNLYLGNRLDSEWAVSGGGDRFVANVPRAGQRQERRVEGPAAYIGFDTPYAERPTVEVTPETPARWGVEFERVDGAFVGATVRLDGAGTPAARVRVRPP